MLFKGRLFKVYVKLSLLNCKFAISKESLIFLSIMSRIMSGLPPCVSIIIRFVSSESYHNYQISQKKSIHEFITLRIKVVRFWG